MTKGSPCHVNLSVQNEMCISVTQYLRLNFLLLNQSSDQKQKSDLSDKEGAMAEGHRKREKKQTAGPKVSYLEQIRKKWGGEAREMGRYARAAHLAFQSRVSPHCPTLKTARKQSWILHCCCSFAKLCMTLWPHGLQHNRLPRPSLSPRVYSNLCHWVSDAIQPSHRLSPPSSLAFNLSQHQGLFQWVGSSCQVAKVLELQLQSFQ